LLSFRVHYTPGGKRRGKSEIKRQKAKGFSSAFILPAFDFKNLALQSFVAQVYNLRTHSAA
jgi:hypothetical protein